MWDNPFCSYSKARPANGDVVRAFVYGPVLHGYWIDPGRTTTCGTPSREQKRLVEDGVELTEHVIAAVRTGVTPRELGVIGDSHVRHLGYSDDTGGAIWELFGHSLSTFWLGPMIPAHGAGDYPDGGRGYDAVDRPLHRGQVFTVESFLREPGVGMVAFEQIFIVEDDGVERITNHTPMLFW